MKKIQIEPKVMIGKISNGWVIQYETDNGICQEAIVLNDETQPGDIEWAVKLRNLLYLTMEALGEYGSKHYEYNVYVDIYKNGKIVDL